MNTPSPSMTQISVLRKPQQHGRFLLVMLLSVACLLLTPLVKAQAIETETVLILAKQLDPISLEQATQMIKEKTACVVLKAKAKQSEQGHVVYQIRTLQPSGLIKTYHIDSQSGAFIR